MEASDAAWLKTANLSLAGNDAYCVLVDVEDMVIISKEWQAVTASREYVQKTIAKAIIVKNLGHALLASFYLKFNKPAIRTRAFKNRQDAINWLRLCYQTYQSQIRQEMLQK